MSRKAARLSLLLAALLWLSACGARAAAPDTAPASTATAAATAAPIATATAATVPQSGKVLEPQTRDGGGVSVSVTPKPFAAGAPLAFDVAMNTHAVDLQDDLVKASSLRDDRGSVYAPLAWDGDEPGGHHRQGTLKFAALPAPSRSVVLVIRGVAGVKERIFAWDLAQ